jgi:SAM-dependent methyltransferase
MLDILHEYSKTWERKPVLRAIYGDFYDRIVTVCVPSPGVTIEIGGGIGNLKRRLTNVVATDIQFAPWLDCVADAQHLPFKDESTANIVMVDVLHHLELPTYFFREASRVLRVDGRIVMVEPAITWGSALFYRLFHQEPVRTSADPLVEGTPNPNRDPYDSNQAIPTLIATRDRDRFHAMFPTLCIRRVDWFSLAVYPLSGGFKAWNLVPVGLAPRLLRFEAAIERHIGRLTGFRMLLVIEKTKIA